MPRQIKSALRFHSDRIQSKWGVITRRHRFGESLPTDLRSLLSPGCIAVDVGANVGQTVQSMLKAQPRCIVHAFEPGQEPWTTLTQTFGSDPRVRLYRKAIAPEAKQVELHVMRGNVGSSLLRPDRTDKHWLDQVRTDVVDATRLDDFLAAEVDEGQVQLLKVDTQGFDLEALRSAGEWLQPNSIKSLVVELNFEQFYQGQARAVEIVEFLNNAGYRPAAFYELHRSATRTLEWCDALFLPA